MLVKDKIISGFPCNNNTLFTIITEKYGMAHTSNKEAFDRVMAQGYVEVENKLKSK